MATTDDIRAVIAEAKSGDQGNLYAYVQRRVEAESPQEWEEIAAFLLEIIEAVPLLIDHAVANSEALGVRPVTDRLLAEAVDYFLEPVDYLMESVFGLVGLLDDAYLSLKFLSLLRGNGLSLVEVDLEAPLKVLGTILGPDFTNRLDEHISERFTAWAAYVMEVMAAQQKKQQPANVSTPQETPAAQLDSRLVGKWVHTDYMSSGGFSLTSYFYRVFGPDGRFVEMSRSSMDATYVDSGGNWAGWSNMATELSPNNRGRWQCDGDRLTLYWDDDTYRSAQYNLRGRRLFLTYPSGKVRIYDATA